MASHAALVRTAAKMTLALWYHTVPMASARLIVCQMKLLSRTQPVTGGALPAVPIVTAVRTTQASKSHTAMMATVKRVVCLTTWKRAKTKYMETLVKPTVTARSTRTSSLSISVRITPAENTSRLIELKRTGQTKKAASGTAINAK